MNEILQLTKEFMKQGLAESKAYKIALATYNKKHGFVLKTLAKKPKKINLKRDIGLQEANDNRNRNFIMHPEIIALQELEELQAIHRLLEQILKTKTL